MPNTPTDRFRILFADDEPEILAEYAHVFGQEPDGREIQERVEILEAELCSPWLSA